MPKFKVTWKVANYGESDEIIEADNLEAAVEYAYEACRGEAEGYMHYSAEPCADDEGGESES